MDIDLHGHAKSTAMPGTPLGSVFKTEFAPSKCPEGTNAGRFAISNSPRCQETKPEQESITSLDQLSKQLLGSFMNLQKEAEAKQEARLKEQEARLKEHMRNQDDKWTVMWNNRSRSASREPLGRIQEEPSETPREKPLEAVQYGDAVAKQSLCQSITTDLKLQT